MSNGTQFSLKPTERKFEEVRAWLIGNGLEHLIPEIEAKAIDSLAKLSACSIEAVKAIRKPDFS
jgi:hypothetical protein